QACLAKDPDARLRSAHDLVVQLQMVADGRAEREVPRAGAIAPPSAARAPRPRSAAAMAGAALAGALAAAFGLTAFRTAPAPSAREPIQFTIPPPETSVYGQGLVAAFAVSPDGRHIVFVASTPAGARLFDRELGSLVARQLPGTEFGNYPFWSPDGK